jgi:hypothetical protein
MSSFAVFVLVVVIPIWTGAAILIRWIEAWGEKSTPEASAYLATPEEMARRIAVLEDVLNADRASVIHEN